MEGGCHLTSWSLLVVAIGSPLQQYLLLLQESHLTLNRTALGCLVEPAWVRHRVAQVVLLPVLARGELVGAAHSQDRHARRLRAAPLDLRLGHEGAAVVGVLDLVEVVDDESVPVISLSATTTTVKEGDAGILLNATSSVSATAELST